MPPPTPNGLYCRYRLYRRFHQRGHGPQTLRNVKYRFQRKAKVSIHTSIVSRSMQNCKKNGSTRGPGWRRRKVGVIRKFQVTRGDLVVGEMEWAREEKRRSKLRWDVDVDEVFWGQPLKAHGGILGAHRPPGALERIPWRGFTERCISNARFSAIATSLRHGRCERYSNIDIPQWRHSDKHFLEWPHSDKDFLECRHSAIATSINACTGCRRGAVTTIAEPEVAMALPDKFRVAVAASIFEMATVAVEIVFTAARM
ncbi:hypothetical protein DFH27DRAFT_639648 [Peziza echinospora]|nr:hypothetical protein DFH27DRAFT_639648 [Peziza echinospora]